MLNNEALQTPYRIRKILYLLEIMFIKILNLLDANELLFLDFHHVAQSSLWILKTSPNIQLD